MEVHHPHHSGHNKKWSELLLEFFMLFLAVTLGFFAENIRETIAEKNKKKETLEAVANDFKKDFEQLNFHRKFVSNKIKICDSIDFLIDQNPKLVDQQVFYRLMNNSITFWKFNSNSRSRIESEARGYFSEKGNEELANCISKYNFHLTDFIDNTEMEADHYVKFYEYNNLKNYLDMKLERIAGRFPNVNLPHKLGIKPISDENKERLRGYLIGVREFNDISLYNIDSLQFYANKAIQLIKKQKE